MIGGMILHVVDTSVTGGQLKEVGYSSNNAFMTRAGFSGKKYNEPSQLLRWYLLAFRCGFIAWSIDPYNKNKMMQERLGLRTKVCI
jgi:hypothetical protein